MIRGDFPRIALLSLLALTMLLVLTACEEGDVQLVKDFAQEWAKSKDLDPSTLEGIVNIGARAGGGSTGDDEADAALDAGMVIKNIQDADNLMDQGRKNRDAAAMDKAIKKRPEDWSYNVSRASLALEQGDLKGYHRYRNEAWRLIDYGISNPRRYIQYTNQRINELEAVKARLGGRFQSQDQCHEFYNSLKTEYAARAYLTGSKADQERVDQLINGIDQLCTR